MSVTSNRTDFVPCLHNEASDDLQVRKVYRVLPDESAAKDDYVRVIDESGEDYLYPATFFAPIQLSESASETLLKAA